jgi:hypothetical protein
MNLLSTVVLVFALVTCAGAQTLTQTIDFMNNMMHDDARQIFTEPSSQCKITIVSWHSVESMLLGDDNWTVFDDTKVQLESKEDLAFPRYTRLNMAEIDPSSVGYMKSGFSTAYVKRFYDEHPGLCKTADDRCKREQMIAFDAKLGDMGIVSFKSVDLKPVIERGTTTETKFSDRTEWTYQKKAVVEKMGICFTSQDRASRFATAFKHAIELCGGKESMFAPAPEAR